MILDYDCRYIDREPSDRGIKSRGETHIKHTQKGGLIIAHYGGIIEWPLDKLLV